MAQQKRIHLVSMKTQAQSLASLSGLRIWHCYGVGCRHGSDLELLWLWHRPASAAPIRPLAWEPPYATGVALEKAKKKKKDKKHTKTKIYSQQ